MPFTAGQLISGSNYSLKTYQKEDPIDQINTAHRTLDWLVKNKEVSTFGNGVHKEPIYKSNDGNYQNYFAADQVTYDERDPVIWTEFPWYNNHEGFWFDEDRLVAAGIYMTEEDGAIPTAQEKETLIDLLKVSYTSMKNDLQANLALELLRDGSQSTKACPGLAALIGPTPSSGVVGGIDPAVSTYWQNNVALAVTGTAIVATMETTLQNCMRYGGKMPDFIVAGQAFINNYRVQAGVTINRQLMNQGNAKGGVSLDAGVTDLYFHGIPIIWDPDFETLDTVLSTTTQTKTCYFLNSKSIKLRPVKNFWMLNKKPETLPDRYVYYFAQRSKYSLTVNQRNDMAVISIA